MRPVNKTSPVLHAKALASADQPGTFEAIFAVMGNEDRDGDILEPGAFNDSFTKALPKLIWSHDWMTPPIGVTLEAEEIDSARLKSLLPDGIPDGVTGAAYAKARLFVDAEAGEDVPLARHVNAALKASGGDGRAALNEFSWGGTVTSETVEHREDAWPVWHLNSVDLMEFGPCLKGVNPATELLAAKALVEAGVMGAEEARAVVKSMPPRDLRRALHGLPPEDEATKNVLSTDDLTALRSVLGLPQDASTADTLAALRGGSAPAPVMAAWSPESLMALAGLAGR